MKILAISILIGMIHPTQNKPWKQFWPAKRPIRVANSTDRLKTEKLSTMLGTWYEYLSTSGNDLAAIGWTIQYTGLGATVLPGTSIDAEAVSAVFYSYDTFAVNGQCRGYFAQSYFTVDGQQVGISYDTYLGDIPYAEYVLYDDYTTTEIVYQCAKKDLASGMCTMPKFFVNTRIRPDLMSQETRIMVEDIANRVLSPYCYSVDDLTPDLWGSEYATPCITASPRCFLDLIQGIKNGIQ